MVKLSNLLQITLLLAQRSVEPCKPVSDISIDGPLHTTTTPLAKYTIFPSFIIKEKIFAYLAKFEKFRKAGVNLTTLNMSEIIAVLQILL